MRFIGDMNAHKLVAIGCLGVSALLLELLLRKQYKMEEAVVVDDVERYLKFSRLQGLVRREDNVAVSTIESAWNNEAYKSNLTVRNTLRP
jgi:hypothetical protein